jgi:hypothetical protein
VGVPLALAGVLGAHAIANALFGPPEGQAELLASHASGAAVLPVLVGTAVAVVLLGLGLRVAGWWSTPRSARAVAVRFACLPPLAFVLLESCEGFVHRGTVPFGEAVDPTFLAGLALQLPFAFAAYVVARLLLQAGDRVRSLLFGEPSVPVRLTRTVRPLHTDVRSPSSASASSTRGRAPPVGFAVSG